MNKKIRKLGTAVLLCLFLTVFFGTSASAQIDEEAMKKEEEKIREEKEKEKEKTDISLTPDGNLTLIDDIDEEHSDSLQFMTVQTRNGNYFYIIVDRNSKEDNVYFLNMVDETDLLDIIPEDERGMYCDGSCMKEEPEEEEPAVEMPEEPGEEEPSEPEPEEEGPVEEPEGQAKPKDSKMFLYFLILVLGGGTVAGYYFLKIRPGRDGGGAGMDFLDDDDYEDDAEEPDFANDADGYTDREDEAAEDGSGEEADQEESGHDEGEEDPDYEDPADADYAKETKDRENPERQDDPDLVAEDGHAKETGMHHMNDDPRYNERMVRFMEQLREDGENGGTDERGEAL